MNGPDPVGWRVRGYAVAVNHKGQAGLVRIKGSELGPFEHRWQARTARAVMTVRHLRLPITFRVEHAYEPGGLVETLMRHDSRGSDA